MIPMNHGVQAMRWARGSRRDEPIRQFPGAKGALLYRSENGIIHTQHAYLSLSPVAVQEPILGLDGKRELMLT